MVYLTVLVTTILVLEVLRRGAGHFGLISYPGAHRHHTRPTPLVGGIGIYIGLVVGILLLPVEANVSMTLILAGAVLVGTGAWDDIHEISFVPRFVAQALAVAILAWFADVSLRDLGRIVGPEQVFLLGRWGIALTIFSAVGVINAVNMSDGLDGLAGGLTLVACAGLLAGSYITGVLDYVPFVGIVMAAVGGFLVFNARLPGLGAARLYLGDAGSLLIGFILAWLLIAMTQGATRVVAPVTALWIFALPLFDAVSALLRRPLVGRSPFLADRTHYHHYLREHGFSVNQTLLISIAAAGALALVGLIAEASGVPEYVMFYAFLGLFLVYFSVVCYLGGRFDRRHPERTEVEETDK